MSRKQVWTCNFMRMPKTFGTFSYLHNALPNARIRSGVASLAKAVADASTILSRREKRERTTSALLNSSTVWSRHLYLLKGKL